jgi:hypothetical protein
MTHTKPFDYRRILLLSIFFVLVINGKHSLHYAKAKYLVKSDILMCGQRSHDALVESVNNLKNLI